MSLRRSRLWVQPLASWDHQRLSALQPSISSSSQASLSTQCTMITISGRILISTMMVQRGALRKLRIQAFSRSPPAGRSSPMSGSTLSSLTGSLRSGKPILPLDSSSCSSSWHTSLTVLDVRLSRSARMLSMDKMKWARKQRSTEIRQLRRIFLVSRP